MTNSGPNGPAGDGTARPSASAASRRNWVLRGVAALLQGRVPQRMQLGLDRLMLLAGVRYRQIRIGRYKVLVRRNSWDERTARRVVGEFDYTPVGDEIGPTDTVIDIGANIGCFTVVAATAASRGRVLAFEPDSENHSLAVRNVELNGLSNVLVLRKAVSGTPGTLRLFRGGQVSLHTTVPGRLNVESMYEEVEAVTLRQIFEEYWIERCAFMKLDCEGAEYDILYRSTAQDLQRVDQLAVKYHAVERKKEKAAELVGFLERCGFGILELTDYAGSDDGFIRARLRRRLP